MTQAAKIGPPLPRYQPVIVAHRGLHDRAPENSLAAFRAAFELRLPWVECDVWATADAVPVVLHDETLDRMTTGKGVVWWQHRERLQPLRLRYADGRVDESSPIPAFEELARLGKEEDGPTEALPGRDLGLLVEIKPPDSRPLVLEVLRILEVHRGRRGRWRIQSFDEGNLVHTVAARPDLPVAFLAETPAALERGLAHGWRHVYVRHDLLDEPTARRMRGKGVTVGVWTPTTEQDLRRVIDLRADVIITDDPIRAALLLGLR